MPRSLGFPDETRKGRLLLFAVIVGSVPAALAGFALSDKIESIFHGVGLTLAMLPLTGAFLIATRWAKDRNRPVSLARGLIVGIGQAIAILPGISRSGMTIGSGLLLGVAKEEAVKFSFLLSIPAIGGAALLKLLKGSESQISAGSLKTAALSGAAGLQNVSAVAGVHSVGAVGAQNLAIAGIVAFFSAILAAKLLFGVVRRGKLEYFGYYCLAIGLLGLILLGR